MRSITLIILLNPIVQARDFTDTLIDEMVARLGDRMTNLAELDQTTAAKAPSSGTHGKAIDLYQPTIARRVTSGFGTSRIASPVAKSLSQASSNVLPVGAAMDTLSKYGFGSSPIEKLALTAIAATRDVSMRAQVKSVFESMDPPTQVKVRALASDVVQKAEEVKEPLELKMTDLAGVGAPTGFFDPVGFSTQANAVTICFLREAELKHGRLGMLASLGIFVTEAWHPLYGGNFDKPAIQALQDVSFETFWPTVLSTLAFIEISSGIGHNVYNPYSGYELKDGWSLQTDPVPGDFGFDPLGLKPKDATPSNPEWISIQNKEINNGRLAMLAAGGMIAQELVTGEKIFR
jgi:hypothetical protein